MFGQPSARRFGSLALLACAEALLAFPDVAGAQSPPKSAPPQKEISQELANLERDDQKDQNDPNWNEANEREFLLRAKARRDRVMEIIAAGALGSMEDFRHASLLMQHGGGADDYLLAHALALPAAAGKQMTAPFLAAATLDRFLLNVEKPQIFSTQSASPDPAHPILAEPFDDSMSESIRILFELPPLKKEVEGKPAKSPKAPSVKELPKLLKAAEARKPGADMAASAEDPDWLVRAREIAAAGAMKSKQDFFLAAQVLGYSTKESDLLQAHVLAMAAALQGHEQGLAASAITLDRYLVAIGRPPRFGTTAESATGGGSPESSAAAKPASAPAAAPFHDVVLRAYGLKPAK